MKNNEILSGFIYFSNERIIDVGIEPSPGYELSELVINYDYRALAVHGFSIAIDIFKYVFRNNYSNELIDSFSNNELEKIINNVLYELYMNGITLPVIYGYRIDIVNKVIRENDLDIVLIHSGELSESHRTHNIIVKNNKLFYNDRELGDLREAICKVDSITNKCIFIDTTNYYSQNTSMILRDLMKENNYGFEQALHLLLKPYVSLGFDNGCIDKNSKPDLVIHDLRNSLKTTPYSLLKNVLLKNYPPDQVFINGDLFFDHGESLVLLQYRIDDILLKY